MKRIHRILFNTLTAISLLVALAAALWAAFYLLGFAFLAIAVLVIGYLAFELFGAGLLEWLIRGLWNGFARKRAIPPGHCPACGYDMRANPARCSECGHLSTENSMAGDGGDAR